MPISSSEENNQLLEAQNLPIDRKLFQNSKKKKISKTARLIEGVRLIRCLLNTAFTVPLIYSPA